MTIPEAILDECPFCGCNLLLENLLFSKPNYGWFTHPINGCFLSSEYGEDHDLPLTFANWEEQTIAAWNRRTPAVADELIAELEVMASENHGVLPAWKAIHLIRQHLSKAKHTGGGDE